MTPPHPLLTVAQVAAWLQCSESSVYDLARQRKLRSHKIPGVGVRFRPEDVEVYVDVCARQLAEASSTGTSNRPTGTRCAKADDEVAPGLTRDELKKQAGV